MSKFDFQFYNDDLSLQKISSTLTSLETTHRNLDMPLFYYYPDEFSITHSIKSSQVVDVLQSSFYDSIYFWLKGPDLKRFPCLIFLPFVDTWSNLILSIFPYEAFQFILLIIDMFYFAGLQMLWWLHWLFHFT